MHKYLKRAALCLALLAGPVAQVSATLIVDAGPRSSEQTFFGGDYVSGTEFTLSLSTTIDGLGFIDIGKNGLLSNHRVGLWDAGGTLLVEALVTNSSAIVASASSLGQWFVQQITPLVLGPGTYRVAGSTPDGESNALSNDKVGNGATLSAGYVRTDFPNGGFGFPNLVFSSEAVRSTVTTNQFDVQPVPEPGTLALFSISMLGIGLARRQKA